MTRKKKRKAMKRYLDWVDRQFENDYIVPWLIATIVGGCAASATYLINSDIPDDSALYGLIVVLGTLVIPIAFDMFIFNVLPSIVQKQLDKKPKRFSTKVSFVKWKTKSIDYETL